MTVEPTVPGMQTGMEVLEDFYGIDGDDQINGTGSIYAFTENASFRDGTLNRCIIRPADTVACLNGQNVKIVNSTLDGVARGATVELGTHGPLNANNPTMARCSNITAINTNGGEFVVNQAIIDGFRIDGDATLTVRIGQVNNMCITQDSNVILRTEGGVLNRVNYEGANFDCRSSFAGAIIRGGEIRNSTFLDVDCTHSDWSGLHIEGCTMRGNFDRASLRNMSIRGDLSGFAVTDSTICHNVNVYDPQLNNYVRIDSPEQFRGMQQRQAAFQQTPEIATTLANSLRELQEHQAHKSSPPVVLAQTPIVDQMMGPVLARPDRPGELTPPTQGGDRAPNLITGGEHFAHFEQDGQGARQNQQTLQTSEALDAAALAARVAAEMDGYSRG